MNNKVIFNNEKKCQNMEYKMNEINIIYINI